MDHRSIRSTISVLRTVLHLLEGDPALRPGSATVLEFRRATMKLIAEIQSDYGLVDGSMRRGVESVDGASMDTPFKAINDNR